MHCFLYHIPYFLEIHGDLSAFSGQGTEKMNDEIKLIHSKRSNKFDPAYDDLVTRKRMEFLLENHCSREKRKYIKANENYWEEEIYEKNVRKRLRIQSEIEHAHSLFEECLKENEPPLEQMSVSELKEKLKSLGLTCKARKKETLILKIREAAAESAST